MRAHEISPDNASGINTFVEAMHTDAGLCAPPFPQRLPPLFFAFSHLTNSRAYELYYSIRGLLSSLFFAFSHPTNSRACELY